MTYRSGVLVLSLAIAGCGDDGVATTEQGSSSGTDGQDTTTGKPTTNDPTVDPTVPTTTTPTTTVDPSATITVSVTDTDSGPTTDTDTGPVTATDTGDTSTTGTTGDTTGDTTGVPPNCGDGVLDADEECDDGAANGDDQACRSNCSLNVCGDGFVGPGEGCDDGQANGDDQACKLDCTPNVCGDGALGPDEACDDGANNGDNNACKSDCTPNVCGDGLMGPGEGCDDGNMVDDDDCTNACAVATCGDGIVSMSEACDDGNADDNDLCTNACTVAACGDGFTQAMAGEGCDDGANNGDQADCTGSCNPAACGDGLIHNLGSGTEECDNGPNNGPGQLCNAMCALNVCGDGDQGPGEGCDDGNLTNGDGCDSDCALEVCGDGKTDANEECDDGQNGDQDDGCTDQCLLPVCGDGFPQPNAGEQCDLGANNSDTGACTLGCKDAACGDGLIQAGVEQCDDGPGNNADSKACKADCSDNFCGDGFVEVGVEECDDGNAVDNDGCSNVCKAALCNDGVKNGGETEVDCGGPSCSICPTVIMFAGGLGAPGNLGGAYTIGTGWTTTPLDGQTNVGVDVAMTTSNIGVGVMRFIKGADPQNNQLQYVTWDSGVWTQPAQIGTNSASVFPSIDAADDTAQVVFRNVNTNDQLYAAYANGVWSPAVEMSGSNSTTAGDVAALGGNLVHFYYNSDNAHRLSSRDRVGGLWSPITPYAGAVNLAIQPVLVAMSAGNAELMGFWSYNALGPVRYGLRTNGAWGAANAIPNVLTDNRIAAAAGPGGSVAVVYRGQDGKFHSTAYAAGLWFGPFDMPTAPDITGTPAITGGVGAHVAETVFISAGKIYHSSFNGNVWSNPTLVGGASIQSVSLARSK